MIFGDLKITLLQKLQHYFDLFTFLQGEFMYPAAEILQQVQKQQKTTLYFYCWLSWSIRQKHKQLLVAQQVNSPCIQISSPVLTKQLVKIITRPQYIRSAANHNDYKKIVLLNKMFVFCITFTILSKRLKLKI